MLRRITGFAIRRPVLVLLLWAAVVLVGYGVGTGVFGKLTSEVGTVPGSPSTRADEVLAAAAPGPPHLTAIVTGRPAADPRPSGLTAALADVQRMPAVANVSAGEPAKDGRALLFDITLRPDVDARPVADRLRAVDRDHVVVAGGPLTGDEFGAQAQSDVQRAETLTLPAVLILLVLVFG